MKTYHVNIGHSSFTVEADNLKAAKKLANFHKRMEKLSGCTTVKLNK